MKTNFEKHVAAFDQVLGHCNALGSVYSPVKESLKLAAMTAQLSAARQTLANYATAKLGYASAINERQRVFSTLGITASRICAAMEGTDASSQLVEDVRLLKYKLRGATRKRKTLKEVANAETSNTSRGPLSQLDYDSKIRNFAAMIELLKLVPTYLPKQKELTVTALLAKLSQMMASHRAVLLTMQLLREQKRSTERRE
ncbi:MAG TPA: hypothetical protein VD927_17910 [Chryseosolibacter sp.]|nr:hypothetical protein [Chryseosolibacter sp.]